MPLKISDPNHPFHPLDPNMAIRLHAPNVDESTTQPTNAGPSTAPEVATQTSTATPPVETTRTLPVPTMDMSHPWKTSTIQMPDTHTIPCPTTDTMVHTTETPHTVDTPNTVKTPDTPRTMDHHNMIQMVNMALPQIGINMAPISSQATIPILGRDQIRRTNTRTSFSATTNHREVLPRTATTKTNGNNDHQAKNGTTNPDPKAIHPNHSTTCDTAHPPRTDPEDQKRAPHVMHPQHADLTTRPQTKSKASAKLRSLKLK